MSRVVHVVCSCWGIMGAKRLVIGHVRHANSLLRIPIWPISKVNKQRCEIIKETWIAK